MHRNQLALLPLFIFCLILLSPSPQAESPLDLSGNLTVVSISDEVLDLVPYSKECSLLTCNQDLAVLMMPAGFVPQDNQPVSYTNLGPVQRDSAYFLYFVLDATLAEFEGDSEVLWRENRTVLVHTSGDTPMLTASALEALPGLKQPVRITFTAKPWPVAPEAISRDRTDFHPLVQQLVDEVSLTEYVAKWQILDDFETRYYNTSQNEASSQWLYDTFDSYGLDVEFHYYSHNGTRRNVVATLPGLVNPSRVLYLVGHFDSISGDSQNSAPGADDNGSGTASVLEAARIMSQYTFENTIVFLPVNSEEQGLYGSAAYAADISPLIDVIGCYNFDMVAYAGTDPLPPDLIIYTNSYSQDFAQVLADACTEFVPNDVEPILLVEALSASDHASFWDNGYKACCGIEEEAWGPDFCPWYHTVNDRIEQYPQDYPTNCTKAFVGAAAQMAVPMQPDTPYLAFESVTIDDDNTGASMGNGNGIIEFGETIELTVTLENLGTATATDVSGVLELSDSFVLLLAGNASFGSIAGGGFATNSTPMVIEITTDIPDAHEIDCTLTLNEDPGSLGFTLTGYAPNLGVLAYSLDDTAGGDGDGIAEAGEVLLLDISIQNFGSVALSSVDGSLSGGAYLAVDDTPLSFGLLMPGGQQTAGPFSVRVLDSAPELYSSLLLLNLTSSPYYDRIEEIAFNIGDIFTETAEAGAPGWTHYAGTGGYTDQWHLETYRNHTFGGTTSWKCGGNGGADYNNNVHAVLESSPFTLPDASFLTFWHWMNAEISGSFPGTCYDGGLVEISIDGGDWEQITPVDGYSHTVRDGSNPFPADTPVFSGNFGWQEESFDLSGYLGSARIRFSFGSDVGVTEEGWYVDDIRLHLAGMSAVEDDFSSQRLSFRTASAVPARNQALLRLDLPQAAQARVQIYDAAGRRVRTLTDSYLNAGNHTIAWDGTTDAGVSAESGVFWAKAQVAGKELTARLMLVR
jgi:Peptidase family M28/FlgD Ig-like domain/Immune inhibitor A-like, MAM domain